MVEPERTQTIWHLRVACWIIKQPHTPTLMHPPTHARAHMQKYVILIAFNGNNGFGARASLLRYTYIVSLVYSFARSES